MGVLLGIDYGDARVGIAISDPEEKLARRLLTLQNSTELFSDIQKIIIENSVEKIVVGLPVGFQGESAQTQKVGDFINQLEEKFSLPVIRINEVMTSRMAQENLISLGVKDIKELIDQEAARIILQDYLDYK
jgi:putative Holliday junction resolvase